MTKLFVILSIIIISYGCMSEDKEGSGYMTRQEEIAAPVSPGSNSIIRPDTSMDSEVMETEETDLKRENR